jgi:hypothetical protein
MLIRLKNLKEKIKSDRFLDSFRWFLVRRVRRIFPFRKVIWWTDLTELPEGKFELPENIKITRCISKDGMDKEDLKVLIESGTELMGTNAIKEIDKRFEKGATLWLIKENGCLAGYEWTMAKDSLTHTFVPHVESDIHALDIELFKDFRGRGLYEIHVEYLRNIFKNEGFKRLYFETHLLNKRALRAIMKKEPRILGIARKFYLFGRNIVIWSEMCNEEKK